MVAKDGVMKFYCDKDSTTVFGDLKVGNDLNTLTARVLGNLTVDGNIINSNLQDQIADIQLTPGPPGAQGAQGNIGPTGAQGNVGAQGAAGAQGNVGAQGATGAAAPSTDPTFTGTLTAPTINATTELQVAGANINTLYQQRAFTTAVIPVGTTGQVVSGVVWSGAATSFTVSKTATGTYRFDWTPSIPSTDAFFGNLRNAAGFVSSNGAGSAALN